MTGVGDGQMAPPRVALADRNAASAVPLGVLIERTGASGSRPGSQSSTPYQPPVGPAPPAGERGI